MRLYTLSAALAACAAVVIGLGALLHTWQAEWECRRPDLGQVEAIYQNASFWTGERQRSVDAMAVLDTRRIACVGSKRAVSRLAGKSTAIIDLHGAFVMPGLIDPHTHVLHGGLALSLPDLSSVATKQELQQIVKDTCRKTAAGSWVQGLGWNEVTWGGEQPHKAWLDAACPDKPVALHRMCSHKVVINSAAERLVGLTEETQDPPGGRIYHDENGLTGVLAESAMDIVKGMIPKPSLEERREYALQTSNYLLSQGVTMAHDMGAVPTNEQQAFENLEHVYLHLANQGKLPIRLFAFTPLTSWKRTEAYVEANRTAHPQMHLFWGGLKEFADGSIGASTALFSEPYLPQGDEQPSSGVRTIETAKLKDLVGHANEAGLQVAIHAIGDLAVDEVLGVYEPVAKDNTARQGPKPRHRIEHVQHIAGRQTAERLGKAGIHAVMNPLHLLPDKEILVDRLGPKRAGRRHSYAINTLIQAGVSVSFASDFPVVRSEPLLGVYAAVKRKRLQEETSFVLEESVSVEQALLATTLEPAKLVGLEKDLGTLKEGKLADFVVLDADPTKLAERDVLPKVMQTFVGGRCMYDAMI